MSKTKKIEETIVTGYPAQVDVRLDQIKFRYKEIKSEGIVITHLPNIRYLTNFSGSEAALFIFDDKMFFMTDDRYEEQIKTELYPLPNLTTYITRDIWTYCMDNKLLDDIESLAFEGDRIAYSEAVNIRNQIRPLKFKPTEPGEVERYTVPKAPEELFFIEKACQLAEATYNVIIGMIKPGMEEREIATEIAYQSRKLGSEGDPFDIIVTSGPRGALVHGQPTDRKIKVGDIVIMDFGCKYHGFVSDITRTVAIGKATKEQKAIYAIIHEAKEAAIKYVRPHMNGKLVDKAARDIIAKAGYGEFFQHSLGHGLGLVPHEQPLITFRKEDQIVPEDCVLAIEPGIYLPNKFGMRIEDNIFVTRNGAKRLTDGPAELVVI